MNQSYSVGTWVMFESWQQWLSAPAPQLGHVGSIVRFENGDLFIRIYFFSDINLSTHWSASNDLGIPRAALMAAPKTADLMVNATALTIVNVLHDAPDTDEWVSFRVQHSTLG